MTANAKATIGGTKQVAHNGNYTLSDRMLALQYQFDSPSSSDSDDESVSSLERAKAARRSEQNHAKRAKSKLQMKRRVQQLEKEMWRLLAEAKELERQGASAECIAVLQKKALAAGRELQMVTPEASKEKVQGMQAKMIKTPLANGSFVVTGRAPSPLQRQSRTFGGSGSQSRPFKYDDSSAHSNLQLLETLSQWQTELKIIDKSKIRSEIVEESIVAPVPPNAKHVKLATKADACPHNASSTSSSTLAESESSGEFEKSMSPPNSPTTGKESKKALTLGGMMKRIQKLKLQQKEKDMRADMSKKQGPNKPAKISWNPFASKNKVEEAESKPKHAESSSSPPMVAPPSSSERIEKIPTIVPSRSSPERTKKVSPVVVPSHSSSSEKIMKLRQAQKEREDRINNLKKSGTPIVPSCSSSEPNIKQQDKSSSLPKSSPPDSPTAGKEKTPIRPTSRSSGPSPPLQMKQKERKELVNKMKVQEQREREALKTKIMKMKQDQKEREERINKLKVG